MKILLFILALISSVNSYGQKAYPKIYLNTRIAKIDPKGEMIKHDSLWILSHQYFEISLNLLLNNKYGADKNDIVTQEKIRSISIVDSKGQPKDFNSSSEFLNWMYSHGYEMKDQTKSKYKTDYTFRKIK